LLFGRRIPIRPDAHLHRALCEGSGLQNSFSKLAAATRNRIAAVREGARQEELLKNADQGICRRKGDSDLSEIRLSARRGPHTVGGNRPSMRKWRRGPGRGRTG